MMENSYYEKIVKNVRKRALAPVIAGSLMALFLVLLIRVYIFKKEWGPAIGFGVMLLIPLALTIWGIVMMVHPAGRNDEKIRQMAADIDRGVIYQDKFFIVSQRVIGSASVPKYMAFRDEVIACWLYSQSINFIPATKQINIYTADPRFSFAINVYGRKADIIEEVMRRIQEFCPNVRMGYTPENFKYVKQVQKEYKKQND